MPSISFNCPKCDRLCAFHQQHAGKRARCTSCGQVFVIPSQDGQQPQKVKTVTADDRPQPGFYRTVFLDSWRIFVNPSNITVLVFMTAAVCFKFFVGYADYSFDVPGGRFQAPLGLIVSLTVWGCLFCYYIEVISAVSFGMDELPDFYMGIFFGFIWGIVKSIYLFIVAITISELPFFIALSLLRKYGIQYSWLDHVFMAAGMFVFPMVVLTLSVGRDMLMVFRPDYILVPILRAYRPYLVVAGLVVAAALLQWETAGYGDVSGRGKFVIGIHLFANLAAQALILVAARSIGLFHRHYSCFFKW